jgi:antirestriction protein
MGRKRKSTTRSHRYAYNDEYQKEYVRRYVFKLNTKHDQDLIKALESMDNRSQWFKQQLSKVS